MSTIIEGTKKQIISAIAYCELHGIAYKTNNKSYLEAKGIVKLPR